MSRTAAAKGWKGATSQEAGIKKTKQSHPKNNTPIAGVPVLSSHSPRKPTCPLPSEQTGDEHLQRYRLSGGCSNKSAARSLRKRGEASAQEDKLRDTPPPPLLLRDAPAHLLLLLLWDAPPHLLFFLSPPNSKPHELQRTRRSQASGTTPLCFLKRFNSSFHTKGAATHAEKNVNGVFSEQGGKKKKHGGVWGRRHSARGSEKSRFQGSVCMHAASWETLLTPAESNPTPAPLI